MFKISTRSRYGLRALIRIAMMERLGEMPTTALIAEKEGISEKYLEHVLSILSSNGIVQGRRGAHGGYSLAIPESELTLLQIIESLEGPVEPVLCVTDPEVCEKSNNCRSREVWLRITNTIKSELSSMYLKDLVDECFADKQ